MAQVPFLALLSIITTLLSLSHGLKFDLQAHTGQNQRYERCIRNFVARDTLVLVTAIVGGQKGDGQMVNMHVCCFSLSPRTYFPQLDSIPGGKVKSL